MGEGVAERRTVKNAVEARSGVTGHNVRYVLAVSMTCAVLILGLLWFYFFH